MSLLVTGFGPFGSFEHNPSEVLARACAHPFQILRVAYHEVDRFLGTLDPSEQGSLLSLGVSASATAVRYELFGTNSVGPTPDVDGQVTPGPIWPGGPNRLGSSLFGPDETVSLQSNDILLSASAGDFLCNYLLFQALRLLPNWKVGFVHIPPFDVVSQSAQAATLDRILSALVSD